MFVFNASQKSKELPVEVVEPVNKTANQLKKKHFSLLCEDDDDNESLPMPTGTAIIISELGRYSSLKAGVEENSCPLLFYKKNNHLLPNMAKISKMIFCITASSVPSECMFSSAGELISQKRTRLNPECAQDLLLLHKNKF